MRILIVNKFLYTNGGSENYIFKIEPYRWKPGGKLYQKHEPEGYEIK